MSVKDAKHLIEQRKRSYSLTFAGPHGEAVIEDLTEVLDNEAYGELFVLSKQE